MALHFPVNGLLKASCFLSGFMTICLLSQNLKGHWSYHLPQGPECLSTLKIPGWINNLSLLTPPGGFLALVDINVPIFLTRQHFLRFADHWQIFSAGSICTWKNDPSARRCSRTFVAGGGYRTLIFTFPPLKILPPLLHRIKLEGILVILMMKWCQCRGTAPVPCLSQADWLGKWGV